MKYKEDYHMWSAAGQLVVNGTIDLDGAVSMASMLDDTNTKRFRDDLIYGIIPESPVQAQVILLCLKEVQAKLGLERPRFYNSLLVENAKANVGRVYTEWKEPA